MPYLLRVISLFFLLLAVISEWYVVAAIIFLWYLFRYTGYELVLLALILDSYYGFSNHLPIISLFSFIAWSFGLMLRPRLLLYTHNIEIVS